jgi:hypothetical protein
VDGSVVGRILLVVGILVALCGLVLVLGGSLPLGRLPGDFSGGSGGVNWWIPLGTSIVISIVLTIALNIALR